MVEVSTGVSTGSRATVETERSGDDGVHGSRVARDHRRVSRPASKAPRDHMSRGSAGGAGAVGGSKQSDGFRLIAGPGLGTHGNAIRLI